ncbi:MAG: hypothetical protein VB853_16225, partial [Pirellulales bacterium]
MKIRFLTTVVLVTCLSLAANVSFADDDRDSGPDGPPRRGPGAGERKGGDPGGPPHRGPGPGDRGGKGQKAGPPQG